MMERQLDFRGVLSWLNSHLGDRIDMSVRAAPERSHRNWGVQASGVLGQGPGERQLVDHLGGVVRDDLIGETRVQLVEDDLRTAMEFAEDHGDWLHIDVGDAQINFAVAN